MNRTLKRTAEVQQALAEVRRLGIPPHPDPPKNWDSLGALGEILSRTSSDAAVLDAGAERYSCLLPWLERHGYRSLIGNNLVFEKNKPVRRGSILYEHGDLTHTTYQRESFDAITCLSVIEHGIEWQPYFAEMARIIKPGGLLVTSTDYFDQPVDTRGQFAYGVPIRIFTQKDLLDAFHTAESYGFHLTAEVDLKAEEAAVTWREFELSYTFIVFAMLMARKC